MSIERRLERVERLLLLILERLDFAEDEIEELLEGKTYPETVGITVKAA